MFCRGGLRGLRVLRGLPALDQHAARGACRVGGLAVAAPRERLRGDPFKRGSKLLLTSHKSI